jgi:hypothetical protein
LGIGSWQLTHPPSPAARICASAASFLAVVWTSLVSERANMRMKPTRRLTLGALMVAVGGLTHPPAAEACACAGTSSSVVALKTADVVFLGAVAQVDDAFKAMSRMNADGSSSVGVATKPAATTFDVLHVFHDVAARQVVIVADGTDCDVPFREGAVWLVYGETRDGRLRTHKCTRTRLREEAASDLAYLEGLEEHRPQGVVSGDVFRRVAGVDGQPALKALFEPLQVIAVSGDRRIEVTTDKWGPFQIVVPPGDYEVWVERAGRAVAQRQAVHLADGTDRQLMLIAEYRDGAH